MAERSEDVFHAANGGGEGAAGEGRVEDSEALAALAAVASREREKDLERELAEMKRLMQDMLARERAREEEKRKETARIVTDADERYRLPSLADVGNVTPGGRSGESGAATSRSIPVVSMAGESDAVTSRSITVTTVMGGGVVPVSGDGPLVAAAVSGDRVNMPGAVVDGDKGSGLKNALKLATFDGSTALETHLMKLRNCARHGRWNALDRACALRNSVEGDAAALLTGVDEEATEEQLIQILQNRFGNENQQERFCAELRCRRRQPGEKIQALHQDVKRLLALGYPGNTGALYDKLSRDCLLESLGDEDLRVKILEKGAKTLDDVLHHVVLLEAIQAKPGDLVTVRKGTIEEPICHKRNVRAVAKDAANTYEEPSGSGDVERRMKQMEEELSSFRREWRESLSQQAKTTPPTVVPQYVYQPPPGWNVPPVGQYGYQAAQQPPSQQERSGDQQQSYGNKRPYSRGRGGGRGACYNCGQTGHISRDCLNEKVKRTSGNGGDEVRTDSAQQSQSSSKGGAGSGTPGMGEVGQKTNATSHVQGVSVSCISSSAVDTYINVDIAGKQMLFLCDTGADHNIISRRMVPNAKLTETSIDLYTASGQRLHVLGKVWLHFRINGMLFDSEFLVTDQLSDAILGFQFMNDFGCEWRFKQRMIVINGVDVKLVRKPSKANVRRVYARERVSLAPDSRANIPVKMCFNSLRANPGNWLMDSKELRPGVLISRCLLPDVDTYAAVQVMNLSGKHQVFHEGLCMGDAESASVLKVGEEGPTPSFGRAGQSVQTDVHEPMVTPLGGPAQPETSGVWEPERVTREGMGGAPETLVGGLTQHLRNARSGVSALYGTISSKGFSSDVEVYDLSESVRPYVVRTTYGSPCAEGQSLSESRAYEKRGSEEYRQPYFVRTKYGGPGAEGQCLSGPRGAAACSSAVGQSTYGRPYGVRTTGGMQFSCGEQLGHVVDA